VVNFRCEQCRACVVEFKEHATLFGPCRAVVRCRLSELLSKHFVRRAIRIKMLENASFTDRGEVELCPRSYTGIRDLD
jgi:hypothetical protein